MSMLSVGEQLRQARLTSGRTVKEIALATKIQPWVLEAIEQNTLSTSMSPVYARGFINAYAKFLQLDPKPLIASLYPPEPSTIVQEAPAPQKAAASPLPPAVIAKPVQRAVAPAAPPAAPAPARAARPAPVVEAEAPALEPALAHRAADSAAAAATVSKKAAAPVASKKAAAAVAAAKAAAPPPRASSAVTPPKRSLPSVSLPKFSMPKVSMPKISFPKISLPAFRMPKVVVPKLSLPRVSLPNVTLPTLPKITIRPPRIEWRALRGPAIAAAGLIGIVALVRVNPLQRLRIAPAMPRHEASFSVSPKPMTNTTVVESPEPVVVRPKASEAKAKTADTEPKAASDEQTAALAKPADEDAQTAAAQKPAAAALATIPLELTITARKPMWVAVKSDGQQMVQQQLEAGAHESWQARRSFEVVIAKPGQADVTLNGQSINKIVLANRGRVAITHKRIEELPKPQKSSQQAQSKTKTAESR